MDDLILQRAMDPPPLGGYSWLVDPFSHDVTIHYFFFERRIPRRLCTPNPKRYSFGRSIHTERTKTESPEDT